MARVKGVVAAVAALVVPGIVAGPCNTSPPTCVPACDSVNMVSISDGTCNFGNQIAPWDLDESYVLDTLPDIATTADCANACNQNCHCKSFVFDTPCKLLSGSSAADMNLPYFYLGPVLWIMNGCFECGEEGE